MVIRKIRPGDAEQFLRLGKRLDAETRFMLREPGEREMTVAQQRQEIEGLLLHEESVIFVAEHEGQLVGYIEAIGSTFRRVRHCATIDIGILQAFSGQGIGTRLFLTVEEWARPRGLHRLELTVMTHNEAGIALYRKCGFEVEGVKRDSISIDGQYRDEYCMAKLLV